MKFGLRTIFRFLFPAALLFGALPLITGVAFRPASNSYDHAVQTNSDRMIQEGRQTFRFDTFGDEAFWGDLLRLHEPIRTVSPRTALEVGLKVDAEALPSRVVRAIERGEVDLDDPAVTMQLLRANAVVGVTGFFSGGTLSSVGIQCALCHSNVDNSVAPGVGRRLDGWANRDLDVGKIISLAPNLQPFADLLGVPQDTVRAVLLSWGPGKFDAELILDGKARRPDGGSAATLLPPAFGLAGVNLHTWTGWGSVTHWNAFVSNLEMRGKGTFYDPRLNDAARFPIAAREGFGNVRNSPDLITSKLAALHHYQLAMPAPKPPDGSYDAAAAAAGEGVFNGQGRCATCHVPPIFTEPGWNMHTPEEIGIDDFQSERSPDRRYRTSPLKGLWTHTKGGFYHDGRFATLRDVIDHYQTRFGLGLSESQKQQLEQYLLSLGDAPVPGVVGFTAASAERTSNANFAAPVAELSLRNANPARGRVELDLSLSSEATADAWVADVSGRRIATLVDGARMGPGSHPLLWDAAGRAPGTYFVSARVAGRTLTRRVTLLAP